jgi:hypothetical protein
MAALPLDDRPIPETAVLGAVEIDDVQPIGAQAAIFPKQRVRVRAVARLRGEVSVQQTHAVSSLEIDGGNETQEHRQWIARKFPSRRPPTAAERSGWNCAP